jgi:transcriptional regulator with XRE-family HTH domain
VSTEKVELVRRAERGARVEEIRKSAEMTGESMAAELNRLAEAHGLPMRYDGSKISRMESGERKISLEDGALLTLIDPEDRGVAWLAFGPPAVRAMRRRRG